MPAAAPLLVLFAAVAAALHRLQPPSAAEMAAADPLVRVMRAWGGPWSIIAFSTVVGLVWWIARAPGREEMRRALMQGLVGAIAAGALLGGLRLAVGAHLPSMIPPEESARPGTLLGLEAGLFEEALFRFMLLPVACALGQRFSPRAAPWIGAILTGLAFAAAHQLDGGAFHWQQFAVRALVPGAIFSALFLWRPAFLVAAHGAAHLILPRLFV